MTTPVASKGKLDLASLDLSGELGSERARSFG